jgi:arylsulfatase A-like enzyme
VKAIMVMYDSLNRRFLPPYGNQDIQAPNYERLSARSVTFDRAYVGSMPCMPARRELHTGRYNFLHRSWGPLEPFDDSMPEILRHHDVSTHLISDHQHYWEDGGATYHHRYTTWIGNRGQEGDRWKAHVSETTPLNTDLRAQDLVNRQYLTHEADQPQTQTFDEALAFLDRNHDADNWFLHIETFDPHEPFFTQQQYKDLYPDGWDGPDLDWPEYRPVDESEPEIRRIRRNYSALVTMCDRNLGRVLDAMDRYNLWQDTMLIVNTDHGFLLGEHDWWAKCVMPFYNEVAHTPLFIWDPRSGRHGERSAALVQTIDLAPTLLDYFGVPLPELMQGIPLGPTLAEDVPAHDAILFGLFGAQVNVTDGDWVYMRGPASDANSPLFEYTLIPTHMRSLFSIEELRGATLAAPQPWTKGVPVLKIPARQPKSNAVQEARFGTYLFDLRNDPRQLSPIQDKAAEERMAKLLLRLLEESMAPADQYQRLGLPLP